MHLYCFFYFVLPCPHRKDAGVNFMGFVSYFACKDTKYLSYPIAFFSNIFYHDAFKFQTV